MQKQQDMGKAHWLSKATLVGGCSSPLPAVQDSRSRGLLPTQSLTILPKYPNSSPLGARDSPTMGHPHWPRSDLMKFGIFNQNSCENSKQ